MTTLDKAEIRMSAAKAELLSYVEKREPLDEEHHRRLVAKLKRAEAEFMREFKNR